MMCGSKAFSRTLAMGERSEMGRKLVPSLAGLFGLGMGIILASFQICGMRFEVSVRLKRLVR